VPEVRGQREVAGAAAARPKAFLEVIEAQTKMSSRIELAKPEQRLGRSPAQADIAFENDITVSRVHSSLVQEGSDFRVFDEQSTSGTYVNEQRVPEIGLQLTDGDEIRMGAVRLRFRQP
jgi:pSer/pThr/pTyr-binding forkhead associated (FHA) protein